jgi:hypothetical protein
MLAAVVGPAGRLDFVPTVKETTEGAYVFIINFSYFCFAQSAFISCHMNPIVKCLMLNVKYLSI